MLYIIHSKCCHNVHSILAHNDMKYTHFMKREEHCRTINLFYPYSYYIPGSNAQGRNARMLPGYNARMLNQPFTQRNLVWPLPERTETLNKYNYQANQL